MIDLASAVRRTYHEGPKNELINGVSYISPGPCVNHHDVAFNIGVFFRSKLKGSTYRVFIDSLSLHLSEENIFVPDVMVVCDTSIIKVNGIYGAPDLVAEVLSPSSNKRDRVDKKKAYEKFGVKEYWIVDIKNKSVEVYVLERGRLLAHNVHTIIPQYELDSMSDEDRAAIAYKFTASIFEGFMIDIRDIFEGID